MPAATDDPPAEIQRAAPARAAATGVTVGSTLGLLVSGGSSAGRRRVATWRSCAPREATERGLSGTRAAELGGGDRQPERHHPGRRLTASRLPALFLTLRANRRWWSSGPLLRDGQRVELQGSSSCGSTTPDRGSSSRSSGASARRTACTRLGGRLPADAVAARRADPARRPAGRRAGLGVLLRLRGRQPAVGERHGPGHGARSPWPAPFGSPVNGSYLTIAHRALALFATSPPAGAGVPTRLGRRYLLYSFAPGEAVINGFLQALIGLSDYARVSGDQLAARAVRRRRRRGPGGGAALRHRRLVALRARPGGQPRLPRARHRLPGTRCAAAPERPSTAPRRSASRPTCTRRRR